mmetsp:Transcript_5533/g.20026  ORF Transcript_5533/g.20026 Transcript_5533/m.20026 type:complete len:313 (+) Transcript_5533:1986-2924(+)
MLRSAPTVVESSRRCTAPEDSMPSIKDLIAGDKVRPTSKATTRISQSSKSSFACSCSSRGFKSGVARHRVSTRDSWIRNFAFSSRAPARCAPSSGGGKKQLLEAPPPLCSLMALLTLAVARRMCSAMPSKTSPRYSSSLSAGYGRGPSPSAAGAGAVGALSESEDFSATASSSSSLSSSSSSAVPLTLSCERYISKTWSDDVASAASLSGRSRTRRGKRRPMPRPASTRSSAPLCTLESERSAARTSQTSLGSSHTTSCSSVSPTRTWRGRVGTMSSVACAWNCASASSEKPVPSLQTVCNSPESASTQARR